MLRMRRMKMISNEEIQNVVDTIVEHFQPQRVVLFGSYATGEATDDSDLDLLVIKDTDLPRQRRLVGLGKKLTKVLVHPMDILVYTPQEVAERSGCGGDFVTQVIREGKTVYGDERANH